MLFRTHPPLEINVLRATNIESQHAVSAIVVNTDGKTEISWGHTDRKIYPRSSIKPIQALAVILSGAAEKFEITDTELALACSSHNGEKKHIQTVKSWLTRIGLSISDLECGAHPPLHQPSALNLQRRHKNITAIYNNCSGKHTGMLATALALGENTRGYVSAHHPVQKLIRQVIEDFCSEKIAEDCMAIDGCSIPTYFLQMKNLALAIARLGDPRGQYETYASASQRIYKACVENPFYIAGTDRYCTRMTTALNKTGLVKTGAEGVMFACLPDHQLGIVVKAHDGAARAAEISMSWILKELGLLNEHTWEEFSHVSLKNWNQIHTGSVVLAHEY